MLQVPKSKKKEECHLINNRSVNLKTYCRIHMQITITIITFHYFIVYFQKIRVNKERFRYILSLAPLCLHKQSHMVHSVQQKLSGMIFRTSRSGSHVTYSCHHKRVVLVLPYLWIRGVFLSSTYYKQSRRVCINQRHQYIRLIWSWNMN
jgi:hypothetical protein